MAQDIVASTIGKTYPVGKSSQFICDQEEVLARVDLTPTTGGYDSDNLEKKLVTVKLTSSSVSLIRGISCSIIATSSLDGTTQYQNTYKPVKRFVLKASGRVLIDTNTAEAELFSLSNGDVAPDNCLTDITPHGIISGDSRLGQYPEDNVLTYSLSHRPHDRSPPSGPLSLAGCASQQYTVSFLVGSPTATGHTHDVNYSVIITGHTIAMNSVSSSSKSMTNSFSV